MHYGVCEGPHDWRIVVPYMITEPLGGYETPRLAVVCLTCSAWAFVGKTFTNVIPNQRHELAHTVVLGVLHDKRDSYPESHRTLSREALEGIHSERITS
jgi:hypothetical protein